MFDDNTKFVAYNDLRWSGVLKAIPKSPNILQPIFEAFTNSLESIRLRQQKGNKFKSYIKIIMDYNSTLDGNGVDLSSLTIIDNGIENLAKFFIFHQEFKFINGNAFNGWSYFRVAEFGFGLTFKLNVLHFN